MALNLPKRITSFLVQHPEDKFTAREIATWFFNTYPEECRQKKNRSNAKIDSDQALIQQLAAEVGRSRPRIQKINAGIKTTEGRPRKYYYTESSDSAEIDKAETENASPALSDQSVPLKEHDLYPLLYCH